MRFADHLAILLPHDVPNRDALIDNAGRHLQMIAEVNRYMNLTRITDPREAVIKHVVDSATPWRLFAGSQHVMDAGTGPGFPGIPLALILPQTQFTLVESTQKKARFVESVVEALDLRNVDVRSARAEDLLRIRQAEIITARALAPLARTLGFFRLAIKAGSRALLYKGPDAKVEITEAASEARRYGLTLELAMRYDLPDALGLRNIVEVSRCVNVKVPRSEGD